MRIAVNTNTRRMRITLHAQYSALGREMAETQHTQTRGLSPQDNRDSPANRNSLRSRLQPEALHAPQRHLHLKPPPLFPQGSGKYPQIVPVRVILNPLLFLIGRVLSLRLGVDCYRRASAGCSTATPLWHGPCYARHVHKGANRGNTIVVTMGNTLRYWR